VDNGPQVEGTGRRPIPAMWCVVQLGGLEASTAQALRMLDYFLATDLLL
jgi:hypothetical protein